MQWSQLNTHCNMYWWQKWKIHTIFFRYISFTANSVLPFSCIMYLAATTKLTTCIVITELKGNSTNFVCWWLLLNVVVNCKNRARCKNKLKSLNLPTSFQLYFLFHPFYLFIFLNFYHFPSAVEAFYLHFNSSFANLTKRDKFILSSWFSFVFVAFTLNRGVKPYDRTKMRMWLL